MDWQANCSVFVGKQIEEQIKKLVLWQFFYMESS